MFASWWESVSHLNQVLELGFWDSDVLCDLLKHILILNVSLSLLSPVAFSSPIERVVMFWLSCWVPTLLSYASDSMFFPTVVVSRWAEEPKVSCHATSEHKDSRESCAIPHTGPRTTGFRWMAFFYSVDVLRSKCSSTSLELTMLTRLSLHLQYLPPPPKCQDHRGSSCSSSG